MSVFLTYTDVLTLEAAIRVMERAAEQLCEIHDADDDEATAWGILATDTAGLLANAERPLERRVA